MKNTKLPMILAAAAALLLLPLAADAQAREEVAQLQLGPALAQFQPLVGHAGGVLTISTPGGDVLRHEFAAGDSPVLDLFDTAGNPLADGVYAWQVVLAPVLSDGVKQALEAARANGDEAAVAALQAAGQLPTDALAASGYFRVAGGAFVDRGAAEAISDRAGAGLGTAAGSGEAPQLGTRDQVIADDLIVQGSACVGLDCVNGESFGFDTLRLKENNLRIKFQDTSNSASFPTVDWQLTANESSNGGADKFSIDDIDGGRTPFTIEASAPSHSLYADDGGRIGFGTSTPVVELHVVDGDTPTLRLEQDGSSGFTSQTWDLAGNETNFFVRDVTNGSQLPFKIRPGADTDSLVIDGGNDIGIGIANAGTLTDSTDAAVHIRRSDSSASLLIEETAATAGLVMLQLTNNGSPRMSLVNSSTGVEWRHILNANGAYALTDIGDGDTEFSLDTSGNLTISGAYSPSSDRNRKRDVVPVSAEEILNKVTQLPINEWSYIADDGIRHIGPMAQDFHAAFGVGPDERHISTVDADGVALAAIQALHQQLTAKEAELEELKARLAALEQRLP